MYAFEITEEHIKNFMNKVFRDQVFDEFEVRGIEINSFTKFEISGALDRDLISEGRNKYYCSWLELKPYVFNIIKGNKRPKTMKFVFSMPFEKVKKLHPKAAAYFLNINFNGSTCICTTASSEKDFSMDKSIDFIWEEYIRGFFEQQGIVVSTL